jgi:hypothetical protein
MLGPMLRSAFSITTKGIPLSKSRKEVPLFRALINAFSLLTACGVDTNVILEEIHQVYGWFDVDPAFFAGKCDKRYREIGDIFLVMYSPKKKLCKITFNQCKHDPMMSSSVPCDFKGDCLQYYVIKERPVLLKCKHKVLAHHLSLLHAARIPSVTSYGVFHNSGKNHEFAYFSSEHLNIGTSTPLSAKTKEITISFTGSAGSIDTTYPYGDLNAALDITSFGNHVEALHIGTPIGTTTKDIIIRAYPQAPTSFIQLQLDYSSDDERNDVGNDLSSKPVVFINVDSFPEEPCDHQVIELFTRLNNLD